MPVGHTIAHDHPKYIIVKVLVLLDHHFCQNLRQSFLLLFDPRARHVHFPIRSVVPVAILAVREDVTNTFTNLFPLMNVGAQRSLGGA